MVITEPAADNYECRSWHVLHVQHFNIGQDRCMLMSHCRPIKKIKVSADTVKPTVTVVDVSDSRVRAAES